MRFAIGLETIQGPRTRGREVELAVRGRSSLRDKSFEAGAAPESVGIDLLGQNGNTQLRELSLEPEVQMQLRAPRDRR